MGEECGEGYDCALTSHRFNEVSQLSLSPLQHKLLLFIRNLTYFLLSSCSSFADLVARIRKTDKFKLMLKQLDDSGL